MKFAQGIRDSVAWYSVLFLLAILFGFVELEQSVRAGQLAFPSAYDNNSYLFEATSAFYNLKEHGIRAFLADFPPHAPLTTVIAMIGFFHLWRT